VSISCGKEKFRTDIKPPPSPQWNEQCTLVVNKADELKLKLKMANGTAVGMCTVPLAELGDKPPGRRWERLAGKGGLGMANMNVGIGSLCLYAV
jgi:hypothetical protein